MSKSVQAECKAKARFQALLRRNRTSRRSLKERKRQRTIYLSILRYSFNFVLEPLGT